MSEHNCLRCGHRWFSNHYWGPKAEKTFKPKRCAKCRSPRWNTPVQKNRRRQSEKLKGNDNAAGFERRKKSTFNEERRNVSAGAGVRRRGKVKR